MRNLKLAAKITLGFGALIVIALLLGGMAVYNMMSIERQTVRLAKEYVPEVALANEVERASQAAMLAMRGYQYTGDDAFLKNAREHLAEVKARLKAASEHAGKFPALVKLKEYGAKAEIKIAEYEQLANQAEARDHALDGNRQVMDTAAARYMKVANTFLEEQTQKLKAELKSGQDVDDLQKRLDKITLINNVIDLGNWVGMANFKAQALRNPKLAREAFKDFEEITKKLDVLKAVNNERDDLAEIADIKAASQEYQKAMDELLGNWLAQDELARQRLEAGNQVLALAKGTALAGMGQTTIIADQAVEHLSVASTVMVVGLALALALGMLLAFFITRSITRPIQRVIAGLAEGSQQVAAAAGQVATSSQSLAEGASQQAASLEETSSSLEEMSSMTKTNADNAAQANSLMGDSRASVDRANQSMEDLTQAMQEINAAGEHTGKIIKTIDEIAFQTNLLALNAAVEAARAGEAGAGFAVVAEEVRNLAMRAAEAAKSTANLIEGTIKKTKEGSELVARTNQAFQEVASSADKVSELVGEIAAASSEQAQGIEQVNKATSEMDKVTQANAANAEESASASEELSSQAATMQGFVDDLIRLAGSASGHGRRGGSGGRRQDGRDGGRSRGLTPRSLPAPAARPQAPPAPLAQRPRSEAEKVIPLEDDFQDF
ncbi:MAG: methyl-accepting chemotaxis protein [Pseudomonadota bacterium]